MGQRSWWATGAVAWIAGIVVLSFLPGEDKLELHTKGHFHTAGHCFGFLLAAVLAGRCALSAAGRTFLVLMVALLGAGVEFAQHARTHMPVEWADVRADLAGVLLGALLLVVGGALRGPESQQARSLGVR